MGKLFISYRRSDSDFVHRLAEKLEERIEGGVFIDRKIAEDDFEQAIFRQIRECNVFLLAVTANTFAPERIHEDTDWIRREVAYALQLAKPIALALREYKTPPPPDELPSDIRALVTKQGIAIYTAFFNEGSDAIAQHCVNIANGGLCLKSETSFEMPMSQTQNTSNSGAVIQTIGDISNSTLVGELNQNIDMKRQDAMARVNILREDKKELLYRLSQLDTLSIPKRNFTMEGMGCYFVFFLFAIGVAFSVEPVLALLVIGATILFFVNKNKDRHHNRESIDGQARKIKEEIHLIDREIEKQLQIANQI